MGRVKAHKPKRQRPTRTWDDTVHDLIAQSDHFDMEMPTLVLGPNGIPVMALPGVFGAVGGNAGSMRLPDSTDHEMAACPVTEEEIEASVLASLQEGWVPPDAERTQESMDTLVEQGLAEGDVERGYRLTPAGNARVHELFRRNRDDVDG